MADPRWQEYKVVERHLAWLDPDVLKTFPSLHKPMSKADAMIYLQALSLSHGRKTPKVHWHKGGGHAKYAKNALSLDHAPSLGLVLHEYAHLLTHRSSFSRRSKRGYMVTKRTPNGQTWQVKRFRAKHESRDGQYIHHGPAFARQLAELIREVC